MGWFNRKGNGNQGSPPLAGQTIEASNEATKSVVRSDLRPPHYFDVVPDELAVRVYPHPKRADEPLASWTYVADGFRRFHQKEVIFTLRGRANETSFPQEPLTLLRELYQHAQAGERFEEGSFCYLRRLRGLFGQTNGIACTFTTAVRIPGVNFVDAPLAVVLLQPDEIPVARALGAYRVLSLLGQQAQYFPAPPWNDRDRPPVCDQSALEQSYLAALDVRPLPGVYARVPMSAPIEGSQPGQRYQAGPGKKIVVRITAAANESIRQAIEPMPTLEPFAWTLQADPTSNVRLVWRPGDTRQHSIMPGDAVASSITGGYLAFTPSDSHPEGGRIHEDGFLVHLRPAHWQRVREALLAGETYVLPAEHPDLLEVCFVWDSLNHKVQLDSVMLYQPNEVLAQRVVDEKQLRYYVEVVGHTVQEYFARVPLVGGYGLTVVMAVKPGRRVRCWVEFVPEVPEPTRRGLAQRLQQLQPPEVQIGPIAFATRLRMHGGPPDGQEPFVFLPAEWANLVAQASPDSKLLIPDDILDRLWPN
jgi:hypothetical protein